MAFSGWGKKRPRDISVDPPSEISEFEMGDKPNVFKKNFGVGMKIKEMDRKVSYATMGLQQAEKAVKAGRSRSRCEEARDMSRGDVALEKTAMDIAQGYLQRDCLEKRRQISNILKGRDFLPAVEHAIAHVPEPGENPTIINKAVGIQDYLVQHLPGINDAILKSNQVLKEALLEARKDIRFRDDEIRQAKSDRDAAREDLRLERDEMETRVSPWQTMYEDLLAASEIDEEDSEKLLEMTKRIEELESAAVESANQQEAAAKESLKASNSIYFAKLLRQGAVNKASNLEVELAASKAHSEQLDKDLVASKTRIQELETLMNKNLTIDHPEAIELAVEKATYETEWMWRGKMTTFEKNSISQRIAATAQIELEMDADHARELESLKINLSTENMEALQMLEEKLTMAHEKDMEALRTSLARFHNWSMKEQRSVSTMKIADLRDQISRATTDISNLQTRNVADIAAGRRDFEQLSDEHRRELGTLNRKLNQETAKANGFEREIQRLRAMQFIELGTFNQKLNLQNEQTDELEEEIRQLRESHISELEILGQKLNQQGEKNDKLKWEISGLRVTHSTELETLRENLNLQTEKANNSEEAAKQLRESHISELGTLHQKLDQQTEKVDGLEGEIRRLHAVHLTELGTLDQNLNQQIRQKDVAYSRELGSLEQKLKQQTVKTEDFEGEIRRIRESNISELRTLQQKLNLQTQRADGFEGEARQLRESNILELGALEQKLNQQIRQKDDVHSRELESLEQKLDQQIQQKDDVHSRELESLEQKLDQQIQQKDDAHSRELESLEQKLNQQQEAYDAEISKKIMEMRNLEADITSLTADTTASRSTATEQANLLNRKTKDFVLQQAEMEQDISDLKEQLDTVCGQLEKSLVEVSSLEGYKTSTEALLSKMNDDLAKLHIELELCKSTASDAATTTAEKINDLQKNLVDTKDTIKRRNKKLNEAAMANESLVAAASKKDADIRQIKLDIQNISKDLDKSLHMNRVLDATRVNNAAEIIELRSAAELAIKKHETEIQSKDEEIGYLSLINDQREEEWAIEKQNLVLKNDQNRRTQYDRYEALERKFERENFIGVQAILDAQKRQKNAEAAFRALEVKYIDRVHDIQRIEIERNEANDCIMELEEALVQKEEEYLDRCALGREPSIAASYDEMPLLDEDQSSMNSLEIENDPFPLQLSGQSPPDSQSQKSQGIDENQDPFDDIVDAGEDAAESNGVGEIAVAENTGNGDDIENDIEDNEPEKINTKDLDYEFLFSGDRETGERGIDVSEETVSAVESWKDERKRARRPNKKGKRPKTEDWAKPKEEEHPRCVNTRWWQLAANRIGTSSDPTTSCSACLTRRSPCVIAVPGSKPVVLPLPAELRVGVARTSIRYYILK